MPVAAPPRPPQASRPAAHDAGEALIKEAQQRARHRRRLLAGAAAVLVAVAAVGGFAILPDGTSPPRGAARYVPSRVPPTPLGPPLVEGPDAASTLLTSWYWGSAYFAVYADGRVIWGGRGSRLNERQLSPFGLELFRDGKFVDPTFLWETRLILRKDLWAEFPLVSPGAATVTPRTYEPSHYAICSGNPGNSVSATQFVGLLPEPAQALLNGKHRTYDPGIGVAPGHAISVAWPVAQRPPIECFEVTPAERNTLREILDATGTGAPGG